MDKDPTCRHAKCDVNLKIRAEAARRVQNRDERQRPDIRSKTDPETRRSSQAPRTT
jgi:hypothetical protein